MNPAKKTFFTKELPTVHGEEAALLWGRDEIRNLIGNIETRIQEIRPKAIIFRFEFYPESGRELVAEGTAHLVAIDADWRVRELPELVKSALSQRR